MLEVLHTSTDIYDTRVNLWQKVKMSIVLISMKIAWYDKTKYTILVRVWRYGDKRQPLDAGCRDVGFGPDLAISASQRKIIYWKILFLNVSNVLKDHLV